MQFVKGPIFANVILADEINRTPPKTQAALLEAMQEHQVTVGGVRYPLEEPFFVLATQNPIEMEGTYPLPEAQLDRFMFNVLIDYLPEDDEVAVVKQTTSGKPEPIEPLFTGEDVLRFHEVVQQGADRRGRGPLRRAPGRRQPAGQAGSAGLHQRLGELGRGTARGAIPGARRQGPARCSLGGPHVTVGGHPGAGPSHVPASHPDRLSGRGRRGHRRKGDRSAAGNCDGAEGLMFCVHGLLARAGQQWARAGSPCHMSARTEPFR